jgi:hypothetical protein
MKKDFSEEMIRKEGVVKAFAFSRLRAPLRLALKFKMMK